MVILITGGSGTLGSELRELLKNSGDNVLSPSSVELNITDYASCREYFQYWKPSLVIHCAAYTDVKASEVNITRGIQSNIVGTCHIVTCCEMTGAKLVHISTDHVFDGRTGSYKTTDPINPQTKYAKSKGAAELAAQMYDNCLIIRTSFFKREFPYEAAFVDQWSSKDYVDVIAPKILALALSDKTGVIHCGGPRRTIYEIARLRKPDVKPISREDFKFPTPRDTSLT